LYKTVPIRSAEFGDFKGELKWIIRAKWALAKRFFVW
jgi:hypothetical protein